MSPPEPTSQRPAPLWRRLLADVRQGRLPGWLRVRQEAHFLTSSVRAAARRPESRGAEIHVFVLWSNALVAQERILEDLRRELEVLEVVRVRWPPSAFSHELTRFYGGLLPPRAEKERHCGTEPFLVVVVGDPAPVYEPRRTPAGIVNARTFDAKQRYRRWTGGGHRIHASLNAPEAEHDLFLLLGRRSADFQGSEPRWDGTIVDGPTALTGADGWQSLAELLTAIEVATPYVVLHEHGSSGGVPGSLELLVAKRTRAALTANVPAEAVARASHELSVGGEPLGLVLHEVGDGSLPRRRQQSLLESRVRDEGGRFVPGGDAVGRAAADLQASRSRS